MTLIVPIRPAPCFGSLTCIDCGKGDVPKLGPTSKRCPECQAIATVQQKRANYQRTAEHQKAQRRARYQENRMHELAYRRERRYGVSSFALAALVAEQGGLCPVCETPVVIDDISMDHDHATGIVRGVLHPDCNSALGLLLDDPARCDRAAAYLRRPATSALRVSDPEMLSVPHTVCAVCGREGTRRYQPQGNGTYRCLNRTYCQRRADRKARGDHPRGRPRTTDFVGPIGRNRRS